METHFEMREQWLTVASQELAVLFMDKGLGFPEETKVSCGWPSGSRGNSKKLLGQCWTPKASAGGFTEIFIAPTVENPLQALGILVHELLHAAIGVEAGHGPKFKAGMKRIGLTGKATSAMPDPALEAVLRDEILPKLGAYPHRALNDAERPNKQGTRMIKVVCPVLKDEKGKPYMLRMTRTWIELYGLPTSPAGMQMVEDGAEDEAGE